MLDQTTFVTFLHWKYWVRRQEGEVIDVQTYSHHQSRVHADRYGATMKSSSYNTNRIFFRTADGQSFFDVDTSIFGAAPGNLLHLVYLGPENARGTLKVAYNLNNRTSVEFSYWENYLPKVLPFVVFGALFFAVAVFFGAIDNGPLRTNESLRPIAGIARWVQYPFAWLGIGMFAFAIYRIVMRFILFPILKRKAQ